MNELDLNIIELIIDSEKEHVRNGTSNIFVEENGEIQKNVLNNLDNLKSKIKRLDKRNIEKIINKLINEFEKEI